jgi:hypothetical protein
MIETVPLANAAEAYGRICETKLASESCWLRGNNHASVSIARSEIQRHLSGLRSNRKHKETRLPARILALRVVAVGGILCAA